VISPPTVSFGEAVTLYMTVKDALEDIDDVVRTVFESQKFEEEIESD